MRCASVIEKAGKGYLGYVPDLPGCVAAGATVGAVKAALVEVIQFRLEGLRAGGVAVPGAESVVEWVED
jgi:predicted RNase H-like HicB family nuclease